MEKILDSIGKHINQAREELFELAQAIEYEYNTEHDMKNLSLPWDEKGGLKLRVRLRQMDKSTTVEISWRKLTLTRKSSRPRSKDIPRGKSEAAHRNNIRHQAEQWEYELAMPYFDRFIPIDRALKRLGALSKEYKILRKDIAGVPGSNPASEQQEMHHA